VSDLCGMRQGGIIIPFGDEDLRELYKHPVKQVLDITIKNRGKKYEYSYRQLCLYWGSCSYLAEHFSDNIDMNHKDKIDHRTRLELGFIKGTYTDHRGLLQWIPDDLNRQNCHQKKRQDFITKAIELHAALIGIYDVEEYKKHLKGNKGAT